MKDWANALHVARSLSHDIVPDDWNGHPHWTRRNQYLVSHLIAEAYVHDGKLEQVMKTLESAKRRNIKDMLDEISEEGPTGNLKDENTLPENMRSTTRQILRESPPQEISSIMSGIKRSILDWLAKSDSERTKSWQRALGSSRATLASMISSDSPKSHEPKPNE